MFFMSFYKKWSRNERTKIQRRIHINRTQLISLYRVFVDLDERVRTISLPPLFTPLRCRKNYELLDVYKAKKE